MEARGGFVTYLGIEYTHVSAERVEAVMPIQDFMREPKGFLHGGCTLTLLETVASYAGQLEADRGGLLSFGLVVNVRHRKPAQAGHLFASAELDRVEGAKRFWHVEARDEVGDIVSSGEVITKVVSRERLAEKERQREAVRARG